MLTSTPASLLARLVVVVAGILFITFAGMVYARPGRAERILMAFASSARAHYLEQTLRLLLGASLVVLSPLMWQGTAFWLLGWSIVISSLVLMLTPWRVHQSFAGYVLPKLVVHMKLFAIAVLALGVILLVALYKG